MSIFTTSTPVIGRPENGEWPLVHPLACLPEPALAPPAQGGIPDDAACMALWDKYGMLDNIRAHSRLVAHIATELARRARAAGFLVNVAAVRASAMLHDIAKTYSVLHGGSHAQLGASWVVAETRNLSLIHILAIIFVGMSVAVLRMFQGTRPTDMPECPRESALSVLPPMTLGLGVLLLGFWMPDGVEKLLRAGAALIGG